MIIRETNVEFTDGADLTRNGHGLAVHNWRVKLADKSSGLTICTDEVRHGMAKYMEVLCEERSGRSCASLHPRH